MRRFRPLAFLVVLKKIKNKIWITVYQNVIINLLLFIHNQLSQDVLKEVVNGIQKSHVKFLVTGMYQNYGYERFTQSIKCSLKIYMIDILQSFECYMGVPDIME